MEVAERLPLSRAVVVRWIRQRVSVDYALVDYSKRKIPRLLAVARARIWVREHLARWADLLRPLRVFQRRPKR